MLFAPTKRVPRLGETAAYTAYWGAWKTYCFATCQNTTVLTIGWRYSLKQGQPNHCLKLLLFGHHCSSYIDFAKTKTAGERIPPSSLTCSFLADKQSLLNKTGHFATRKRSTSPTPGRSKIRKQIVHILLALKKVGSRLMQLHQWGAGGMWQQIHIQLTFAAEPNHITWMGWVWSESSVFLRKHI